MKSRTIRRGAAALAAAALAAGAPAAAAQEDLVERVYELEQEIVVLQRQLETLMDGNRDTASEAASQAAAPSETPEEPGDRGDDERAGADLSLGGREFLNVGHRARPLGRRLL